MVATIPTSSQPTTQVWMEDLNTSPMEAAVERAEATLSLPTNQMVTTISHHLTTSPVVMSPMDVADNGTSFSPTNLQSNLLTTSSNSQPGTAINQVEDTAHPLHLLTGDMTTAVVAEARGAAPDQIQPTCHGPSWTLRTSSVVVTLHQMEDIITFPSSGESTT